MVAAHACILHKKQSGIGGQSKFEYKKQGQHNNSHVGGNQPGAGGVINYRLRTHNTKPLPKHTGSGEGTMKGQVITEISLNEGGGTAMNRWRVAICSTSATRIIVTQP